MIFQQRFVANTLGRSTLDISENVRHVVAKAEFDVGICHVFVRHTSASLIICENADPQIRVDLENFMRDLIPDGDPRFGHDQEGPDDMPAHVRSILTQTTISIPVTNGQCALGTWQGIYLWEHRSAPHRRELVVTVYA